MVYKTRGSLLQRKLDDAGGPRNLGDKMKLLREYYELCEGGICQDLLTEDEKRRVVEEGAIFLTGCMQMSETKNGNGRTYPHSVLLREVENYQKLVKERRALGELDHPDSPTVNLANCSHHVTKIWMDGNKCMGKIEVLNTPSGCVLKALVDAGITLGISSRGMGSVTESKGQTIVEDDFQLICFDMVSDPSTPGAFMMSEAKGSSNVFTRPDKINRMLNEIIEKANDEKK